LQGERTVDKRIENMSAAELAKLSLNTRIKLIQDAAVRVIRQSICHGDSTSADKLFHSIALFTGRSAQSRLAAYLEQWGNLTLDASGKNLKFHRKHAATAWSSEYSAQVARLHWRDFSLHEGPATKKAYDADKEFRTVLERLKKAADNSQIVLHEKLIEEVERVILAYGRSDEAEREAKRAKTLYDSSTQTRTMSASKYAKELDQR
jgi:hypothetical protein